MKRIAMTLCTAWVLVGSAVQADLINEWEPTDNSGNPPQQNVEVKGIAGATVFLDIFSIDTGGVVLDRTANAQITYDGNGLGELTITNLPSSSYTLFLTRGFTSSIGTDLDTNDDGVIDGTPWAVLFDAVGVPAASGDSFLYGSSSGGVDLTFVGEMPNLIFRDGTSDDWYNTIASDNDSVFDVDGDDVLLEGTFDQDPFSPTFGAVNPSFSAVPEPGSAMVLLSLTVLGVSARRRRRG